MHNDIKICYNDTTEECRMFDIYIKGTAFEQCRCDKEKIDLITPYTVFHYIISGEGFVNGQKLCSGQFFSANKNDRLCYFPDTNNPWHYAWVRILGDDCDKAMKKCSLNNGVFIGNCHSINEILKLLNLFSDALDNCSDSDYFEKSAANMLIAMHTTNIPDPDSDYESLRKIHVKEICDYIDNNYYNKIKIDDISKKFYLNRGYIRNLFSEYLHLSPKQYLQKV